MLGAVMFGHRHFQPVIEAIIQLAEKAAKEPRDFTVADNAALEKEMLGHRRAGPAHGLCDPAQGGAPERGRRRQGEGDGALLPGRRRRARAYDKLRVGGVFKELEAKIVRWNILDTGKRIDGRDLETVRPIVCRGRRPAAHPRLGAVHPRRDPGAGRRHARHRRGRAVHRRAAGHLQGDLPAALQLPALSRSARPAAWAAPGRREIGHGKLAWRAIHPMLPAKDEFPYTIRVVSEITEFERLVLDGDRLRHLARADGCGRAAEAADRRHRHGPDPGGRALRGALRHPRRRGSSRRHGLQGGRHRAAASPRCRWTSRSPASPKRS